MNGALTQTQRIVLRTIERTGSAAEVALEMGGPTSLECVNAGRCITALVRRGFVTDDSGDLELTDAGRAALAAKRCGKPFCVCDQCAEAVGQEHRDADRACGREWVCQCGPCKRAREILAAR